MARRQNAGVDPHREAIERIAARPPLQAWGPDMVNLPWDDPAFSERMLREHLSQDHELASRRLETIERQVERMIEWMGLDQADDGTGGRTAGIELLDVTCGPGLFAHSFARRGITVTGVDISPAAIRFARELTADMGCTFIEADVREVELPELAFDAAIYLYGQCEVARPEELTEILGRIRRALRPGAPLAVETRAASKVARITGTAWHTGIDGLFGPGMQLVLTEQGWDAEARATVERHHVLGAETGELTVLGATARVLEPEELTAILAAAGFPAVEFHPSWDGLAFDKSGEWCAAVAR
jgi:2-polyprenyl-3-methyl-5-hydroxy-6-metoxy-1,4-benzoquinol methylase